MKILIKSKYIHYGVQVLNKEIEVNEDEKKMISDLGVKFEVIESEKKEKIKKSNDD